MQITMRYHGDFLSGCGGLALSYHKLILALSHSGCTISNWKSDNVGRLMLATANINGTEAPSGKSTKSSKQCT